MPPSAIQGLPPSKRRCQTTHDQARPLSTGSSRNYLLCLECIRSTDRLSQNQ